MTQPKSEGRRRQYWVAVDRVTLPVTQWRYLVTEHDPARTDWSRLHPEKPFTYEAVREELSRLEFKADTIPPELYFHPTVDEKEERAEIIFREVPPPPRWRK